MLIFEFKSMGFNFLYKSMLKSIFSCIPMDFYIIMCIGDLLCYVLGATNFTNLRIFANLGVDRWVWISMDFYIFCYRNLYNYGKLWNNV